jgi:hypothetical protein
LNILAAVGEILVIALLGLSDCLSHVIPAFYSSPCHVQKTVARAGKLNNGETSEDFTVYIVKCCPAGGLSDWRG